MPEQTTIPTKPSLLPFKWWFKGRTVEGNTIKFEGRVKAIGAGEACHQVDEDMRKQYPDIKWMQGKNVENEHIKYGPTVQQMKTAKRK